MADRETVILKVEGTPIAKKRPRFARRGGFVKTYNSQETEEGLFYLNVKEQIKEKFSEPLIVEMHFIMPRPKSHFGTGKNSGKLKTSAPKYHTSKPDCSNLVKFPEDILNGIAWNDDSQIIKSISMKRYVEDGEEPHTMIFITRLNEKE